MLTTATVLIICVTANFAEQSIYKEVHPGFDKCTFDCNGEYSGNDETARTQCEACCSGCRYLSVLGLASVNGEVQREAATSGCYKTCDDAGKDGVSCHTGCDLELKEAEIELENLDFDKIDEEFKSFSNFANQMLGSFLPMFLPQPVEPVTQIEKEPIDELAKDVEEKPKEAEEEFNVDEFVNNLYKQMGFTEVDDKDVPQVIEEENYPKLSHKDKFALRSEDELELKEQRPNYLSGLWRDRNTVQILLISSITACLFAILWMLCNSSNDPIVRRVAPADSAEHPPAYNVVYGDEKKLPILVVAGIDEQADALPEKVPFGFSTQI